MVHFRDVYRLILVSLPGQLGCDGGVSFVHCCDEKLDAHTGHVISMGRFAFVVYKNRRNEFATDFAVVHIKVASGDSDNEEWPVVIVESACFVPDENNFGLVVKSTCSEVVDMFFGSATCWGPQVQYQL